MKWRGRCPRSRGFIHVHVCHTTTQSYHVYTVEPLLLKWGHLTKQDTVGCSKPVCVYPCTCVHVHDRHSCYTSLSILYICIRTPMPVQNIMQNLAIMIVHTLVGSTPLITDRVTKVDIRCGSRIHNVYTQHSFSKGAGYQANLLVGECHWLM